MAKPQPTRGGLRSCLWATIPRAMLLMLASCQGPAAHDTAAHLVELTRLDPTLKLDIRYATAHNFTGKPVYPVARAYLLDLPAQALIRVQQSLKPQGLGLLIFDAYRPLSVTRALWNAASPTERQQGYVADPATGSRHNRGCAVDLSLYDLKTGQPLTMPSAFDDFSERAHADWTGTDAAAIRHRDLLRAVMEQQGFKVLPNEWWHFNFRGCDRNPLLDIPLDQVSAP